MASSIELLTGRIYSIALVGLFLLDANTKAFSQLQYLKPEWFWLTWSLIVISIVIAVVENWFFGGGKIGLILHAFAVTFTLLTWQWQVNGMALPSDFKPWVWWQLGMGALSGGLALAGAFGWVLIFALPTYWFYFRLQEFSGGPDPMRGLQDAIFTALFSAVVLSTVKLLRLFAHRADVNEVAARAALVEQEKARAVDQERSAIDSMLHQKILATLEAAYSADDGKQQAEVVISADAALDSLRDYLSSSASSSDQVSINTLFEELTTSAQGQFGVSVIDQTGDGLGVISADVALAYKAATIQALDNSFRHAGDKSVARKLRLKAKPNGFKIVIEDNGRGFRPSQVAKDRVGIRRTIRARIESVGGTVKIDSKPGNGCRVILEWDNA
ncbi:MAG: sensor histidine kinase [Micrococcales bacterium]